MQRVPGAVLVLSVAGSVAVSFAAPIERPVAVSPGGATGMAVVEARCPSFSWGAVPDAGRYELEIFRIDDLGTAEIVVRQEIHGAASSWTPTLGQCLSAGGRYAWSIRATGKTDGAGTAWSEPSLFQIADGPGRVELEEALEVVRGYLAAQGRAGTALESAQKPADENGTEDPPPVSLPGAESEASLPPAVGATQMTVDGGIVATSFTGDGSTLTDLNPSNLAAGSAAIDISGTAAMATTATDSDTLDGIDSVAFLQKSEADSEAELEALLTDVTNILTDSETAASATDSDTLDGIDSVAFLQKTEADSEAELEALLTDVTNILTDSETAAAAVTATTAGALAADPTACPTGQLVTDIAADGTLTCTSEPGGVDFSSSGSRTISNPAVNTCNTYTQLTSIVVTIPASSTTSYVVCTATGEIDHNQLNNLVRIGIDAVPSTIDTSSPDRSRVLEALSLSSEEDRATWAVQNVYSFGLAGASQRFALKVCRQSDANSALVIWDPLVCTVVPSRR